ncbi:hypothetical protein BAUCODRAFT_320553 [Baudoinia panamericana UAMH 10762]|uniref:Uncharacterized protein n=1 Tax=Baudoinia panamericana (strain UAMH 10762) TaxID=717646 RepID=M2MY99_BAUPA|nr:uncharacterized protein BAUCODRAFT_320553 [Baudoinia panamericana UAMH 10762]EMC91265.1 hypothetical protein BAUCODRAFT_320553 [Baudoinia panamericana UAMH 10762]
MGRDLFATRNQPIRIIFATRQTARVVPFWYNLSSAVRVGQIRHRLTMSESTRNRAISRSVPCLETSILPPTQDPPNLHYPTSTGSSSQTVSTSSISAKSAQPPLPNAQFTDLVRHPKIRPVPPLGDNASRNSRTNPGAQSDSQLPFLRFGGAGYGVRDCVNKLGGGDPVSMSGVLRDGPPVRKLANAKNERHWHKDVWP